MSAKKKEKCRIQLGLNLRPSEDYSDTLILSLSINTGLICF